MSFSGSVVVSVYKCMQLCHTKPCMMLMSHQVSQSALQCWQQLSCSDIHVLLNRSHLIEAMLPCHVLLNDMVPVHDVLVKLHVTCRRRGGWREAVPHQLETAQTPAPLPMPDPSPHPSSHPSPSPPPPSPPPRFPPPPSTLPPPPPHILGPHILSPQHLWQG